MDSVQIARSIQIINLFIEETPISQNPICRETIENKNYLVKYFKMKDIIECECEIEKSENCISVKHFVGKTAVANMSFKQKKMNI